MLAVLATILMSVPIAHTLRFRRVAVALQAYMPAVHPEMTIWRVKGGSPSHLFLLTHYHPDSNKIQNKQWV